MNFKRFIEIELIEEKRMNIKHTAAECPIIAFSFATTITGYLNEALVQA